MSMTKEQIKAAIAKMEKTPHCESCGQLNPSTDEGYTNCCNELVCYGPSKWNRGERFGTEKDFVRACCWAVAEGKFMAEGREQPEGSSRLF